MSQNDSDLRVQRYEEQRLPFLIKVKKATSLDILSDSAECFLFHSKERGYVAKGCTQKDLRILTKEFLVALLGRKGLQGDATVIQETAIFLSYLSKERIQTGMLLR